MYEQDFESGAPGAYFISDDVVITDGGSPAIDGNRSAHFVGPPTALILDQFETGMRPMMTYEVEFEYSILDMPDANIWAIAVAHMWSGVSFTDLHNLSGPAHVDTGSSGRFSRFIRTGTDPEIATVFANIDAEVLIDNIRIYRIDAALMPSQPRLVSAEFPRLGVYNLYSAFDAALRHGLTVAEIQSTLGLFDLITGYQIDHTLLPNDVARDMRATNPNILIFPYHQSYVVQDDGVLPVGGSAGLRQLFNLGLEDAWFMKGPDGERLEQPLFPNHFQMNHTIFGNRVDGISFTDYSVRFLSQSVLPSGLWDGLHFDQCEWYPNPLLGDANAFIERPGALPPIDLDEDGVEEPLWLLHLAWYGAYLDFYSSVRSEVGSDVLLFGNAGELSNRPSVLSLLNGMQREFTIPLPIADNGDFTEHANSQWYDLIEHYRMAEANLRAPQVINFQFTGYKLGTPTGRLTANSLPDRVPVLEARDFQRMRFGLATVLMGDGFFGYDFVDNTTRPVWFDEYAVNGDGVPVKGLFAKGYLGQPLGKHAEIPNPLDEIVFDVDFESTDQFPLGVVPTGYAVTDVPGQVIDGLESSLFTVNHLQPTQIHILLNSDPAVFPLDANSDYQLTVDYRILDFDPVTFTSGVLNCEIRDPALAEWEQHSAASVLWDAEPGQTGTLRNSVRTRSNSAYVYISLHENATVVLDNIKLVRGTGGAFRRDFEGGIALVNPTPNPAHLTAGEVAGPHMRTGIRRIAGAQDPVTNDGSPVTSGITLSPADGIVLLADRNSAPPVTTPTSLVSLVQGAWTTLAWAPSSGAVAGYTVRYGIQGGDLVDFTLTPSSASYVAIRDLEPGTTYSWQVSSHNFRGESSPYSPIQSFTIPGPSTARPEISAVSAMSPVGFVVISGIALSQTSDALSSAPYPLELAGVRVLVNGVAAPLVSVSPQSVMIVTPYQLAGDFATVEVVGEGVVSPARTVPLQSAAPFVWTAAGNRALAFRVGNFVPIDAANPALPGELISVVVSGTGKWEPPAPNGFPVFEDSVSFFTPEIVVGGDAAQGARIVPSPWLGIGFAEFVVPLSVSPGDAVLEFAVGGVSAPATTLPVGPID